jgi:hypothetical protein
MMAALAAVWLLTVSLSCSSEPSPSTATTTPVRATTGSPPTFEGARLEVKAPFSTATLDIESDGTIRYEASSPDTGIDGQTASKEVSDDEIARLVTTVRETDFFSLEPSYPYQEGVSYEDGSTYTVEVTIEGETKRVTCYESECPEPFSRVLHAIRDIWDEEVLEVGV